MQIRRLPASDREIVFYSEGRSDWPHLGPIVRELAAGGRRVCYVSSEESDPGLSLGDPNVVGFHVGADSARTAFFKTVEAKVVVMTMPDLETFFLKRSVHPAHYVYVFHAIVSSHRIYRKGAFDAYDTVLAVGPHHVEEIRRTEAVYGLRPKAIVEHGCARLDEVIRAAAARPAFVPSPGPAKKVLLAPSWGECSFAERPYGGDLIDLLLRAGHSVVLRLHPMTVRRLPKLGPSMESRFAGRPGFRVETDMSAQESLQTSDLMISDWSGAAFDYGFGLLRPVLFVDTPTKVNNPEWQRLGIAPLEEKVRREIGDVLDPGELARAPEKVAALTADPTAFAQRLRAARERWVFHVGRSAPVAAAHIAGLCSPGDERMAPLQEAKAR